MSSLQSGQNHFYHRIQILQIKLGKGRVTPVENVKITRLNNFGSSPSWYVQWIQIQMDSGDQFRCPVNAWMIQSKFDPCPQPDGQSNPFGIRLLECAIPRPRLSQKSGIMIPAEK